MKPTRADVAAQAIAAVNEGISYDRLDCQAFVEEMVRRAGGDMAYAGSNDMARSSAVYLATLDNAIAEKRLVPGAGLLIHEDTEDALPPQYRGDGLGDFSHVGLYVGAGALVDVDRHGDERVCDVVHSGATMGRVAGSTLANGWTHVIWFREIDYGADAGGLKLSAAAESILNDEPAQSGTVVSNEGRAVAAKARAYVIVTSANGGDVRIREKPERGAITKYSAPVGTRLMVLGERNGYWRVMYKGKTRWLDKRFAANEGENRI